jgi:hypothetical protein
MNGLGSSGTPPRGREGLIAPTFLCRRRATLRVLHAAVKPNKVLGFIEAGRIIPVEFPTNRSMPTAWLLRALRISPIVASRRRDLGQLPHKEEASVVELCFCRQP